jgi:hypothetical protein
MHPAKIDHISALLNTSAQDASISLNRLAEDRHQREECTVTEQAKGGPIARQAAMLCQDPAFRLYLDRRRRFKHGIPEHLLPDGTHNEQDARDWLCAACRIQSRAELDHNAAAAETLRGVQQHFYRWRAKRRATA